MAVVHTEFRTGALPRVFLSLNFLQACAPAALRSEVVSAAALTAFRPVAFSFFALFFSLSACLFFVISLSFWLLGFTVIVCTLGCVNGTLC
jgi:hypothetical protein